MKKFILLVLISLFTLGCSIYVNLTPTPAAETETITEVVQTTQAPTEAPVEVTTEVPTQAITEAPVETATEPVFEGTPFMLNGIQMVLQACMASDAVLTQIAAVPYTDGPGEYYPAHRKVTFQGYPLTNKFFSADDPNRTGGLMVYPVADFVTMNAVIGDRVTSLQNLLATQPANPQEIPLLPIFNAASVFKAKTHYLNFQNGTGVGYLTEYAQYNAPANNYDMFYSFQGLTNDGKYWISIILPVNATYLQEAYDSVVIPDGGFLAPAFDDPNYEANMQAYYTNVLNQLNTTPDAIFIPGLDCLDQFIQSLQIGD